MTNLRTSMDDRLTEHLKKVRKRRIILLLIAHLPVFAVLIAIVGEIPPPIWLTTLSIFFAVAIDIVLLIDSFLHQTLIQMFKPKPPGPHFQHEGFERLSYTSNDGTEMPMWYHAGEEEGVIIFLHGWTSCSHYQLERMKALWDIGWSTVTLDLRGHGEAPPTYIFSSVQAAIDVHHAIAELQRNGMIGEHEELILHGHSLGGFVAQRVVKTWEIDTRARPRVVLESPLIDLPLFIVHKAPWLRMMLPLILRRIARLTQIVEPTSPPWSSASFGPPNWGSFQQGKVLYIQARSDQTLGLAQSEAAQRAFPWLNVHRIANLKHSARGANPERDAIIISWINNHSDSESM